MEDVIENVDLSKVIPIEAKDMTLDPEVYPNIISQSGTGNERTFTIANNDGDSVGTIQFGMEGDNPYMEFSGVELLPEGKGHGKATLGGKIKMLTPEVYFDTKGLFVNYLEFNSGIENNLDVKFVLSGQKEESTIPLGVPIPIKAYGIAGAEIQFFIKISVEGEVSLDFKITNDTYYNVGVKKVDGDWNGFNYSRMDAYTTMNSLSGMMEGKVGTGVNIEAQLLQFTLAGVDVAAGYKTSISGEVSLEEACFRLKDEIYVEATAQIGAGDNGFWDTEIPILSKPLTHKSNCGFQDIKVDSIELKPGETKQLTLTGVDQSDEEKEIVLPDRNVQLNSDNISVVTVNRFGEVRAKSNAKDGDSTYITIKYDNGSDPEVTKKVQVVISQGLPTLDQMKLMAETIASDIKEILVSGWEYIPHFKINDFSTLEDDLKELVTEDYMYNTLKPYYEEYMCVECDSSMFPWSVATDIHFDVLESSMNRLVIQTAELGNVMDAGGFVTYTFENKNGQWLLDDYDYEVFGTKFLNISAEKAQKFLKNYYLNHEYYDYDEVTVTLSSIGTDRKYNWYTNEYYDRTYYTFNIKTEKNQFKIMFDAQDGFFDIPDYFSFSALSLPQGKKEAVQFIKVLSNGIILVEKDGQEMKVRLNNIRLTSETELQQLLTNTEKIELEYDLVKQDPQGNVFANVYADSLFINEWLVQKGEAHLYNIRYNTHYLEQLIKAQTEAKEAKVGLWENGDVSINR